MASVSYPTLNPPVRILMGPGPSNIHPRVQKALLAPIVGHLDPYFVSVMEETMALMRATFRTKNVLTFPISGTGSAGMEAAFANFLEPGDVAVVGTCGFFGDRMIENAVRTGAKVVTVSAEWGKILDPAAIEAALKAEKKVKVLAVVHAETSTGVMQPLGELSKLARQYGALFLVDTVTSLGGQEVAIDDWGIDISYSGSQKCLGCPPGLSPFTASDKAVAVLDSRKTKVPSWYLDIALLRGYWSDNRFYHHTAPISMVYAMHDALCILAEEGLDASIKRHARNGAALQAGLEAMGMKLHAQQGHRLSVLTTVQIPQGVDDAKVRKALLTDYGIEIGGGLGALKGKIWRVGLMGYSSTAENVVFFLSALDKILPAEGYKVETGAGVTAALKVLKA